ncbi:hypothetical protein ACFL35_15805 [Candidatus Riflebacteria bacterium]
MKKHPVFFFSFIFTMLFELITLICRFVLGWKAGSKTAFFARFTLGLRIHHGYVGILLIVSSFFLNPDNRWKKLFLILGNSLFFSDFIHHFLILWPLYGSPEFDIFYPK